MDGNAAMALREGKAGMGLRPRLERRVKTGGKTAEILQF
jgi:hypothetical protein